MSKREIEEFKEIEKVERLEREIEEGIKSLESVSSFNSALFFGLILGTVSNLGATIIYELHLKLLSYPSQLILTIILLVIIPLLLFLWFRSHNKVKASRERLKLHLETVREHKKSIKNANKK